MGIKLFLLACLCSTLSAAAQTMVVYHATGTIVVKDGATRTAAAKGTQVGKSAVVEVKTGSTCMIIGPKGSSVQINKPGNYSYSRIQQLLTTAKNESVTTNFFAYVYDNLVYKKEKTALNVTPVVYRAEPLMKVPQQYAFADSQPTFTWRGTPLKSPVRVQLLFYTDSVLLDTVFAGNQTSFTPTSLQLQPGVLYKWNAEDQYNSSKVKVYHFFMVIDPSNQESYDKAWKAINEAALPEDVKLSLKRDLLLKGYSEAVQ